MLSKLSWSEVDSDSYVGWLVKCESDFLHTSWYKVIQGEDEYSIWGSSGLGPTTAVESYDPGKNYCTGTMGDNLNKNLLKIYRIKKIF